MNLHRVSAAHGDVRTPFTRQMHKIPLTARPAADRGFPATISACSFVQTSQDHNVCRNFSSAAPPTNNFTASVAATDATTFTAEFNIPEVSQVSTIPRGYQEKCKPGTPFVPGITFSVTP